MPSKITKSIAARIPIELYYEIVRLAKNENLNLNDYLSRLLYNHVMGDQDKLDNVEKKESQIKSLLPALRRMAEKIDKEN